MLSQEQHAIAAAVCANRLPVQKHIEFSGWQVACEEDRGAACPLQLSTAAAAAAAAAPFLLLPAEQQGSAALDLKLYSCAQSVMRQALR